MSTFMANPQTVRRQWYIIDAAGRPLGRVATEAAALLRGKHKVTFTPHVDGGDHVIIINAEKAVLTGNKLTQKYYRKHSGYMGGLKEVRYDRLMQTKPEFAMEEAVRGMLPHNTIGRKCKTRLRIYKGDAHDQKAQNPIVWEGPASIVIEEAVPAEKKIAKKVAVKKVAAKKEEIKEEPTTEEASSDDKE